LALRQVRKPHQPISRVRVDLWETARGRHGGRR
jgi:hypothetical protein